VRLPRERFDYSPITSRRPWTLPEGARVAVWTIVDIEERDIVKPMARQSVEMLSSFTCTRLHGIPMMVIRHRTSSEWPQRAKEQLDRLHAEGARTPRAMAPAVHPCISGVARRIKSFEAVHDHMRKKKGVGVTTSEDLYEWDEAGR